jgi:hypothetical protein
MRWDYPGYFIRILKIKRRKRLVMRKRSTRVIRHLPDG